ncbi:DUF2730 family protein [Desulfovibrio sp. JC010]|uniref:DUF2730 family protein n=1 Tax=Desulfovibrio sp. JC010 TaxID=2593641 RepID=UPI0013CFD94A|nr:DUF2730 family protein [Desulfovibrio sp. JC010]NDV27730.1 DUF2730 family protein [Desulfovibrio sp. JC010]
MSTEASLIAEIKSWIPTIAFAGQFVIGWFLYKLDKRFVSKDSCTSCRKAITDEVAKLSKSVDELDDRVGRNEVLLSKQPTQEQFNQLNISMEKLSGGMNVLTERIDGVKEYQASLKELVLRVEDFVKEASKE